MALQALLSTAWVLHKRPALEMEICLADDASLVTHFTLKTTKYKYYSRQTTLGPLEVII